MARASGDPGTAAQAEALAARLTTLAAEDADAYEAAVRALGQSGGRLRDTTTSCSARCCAGRPTCLSQIAESAGDVALLAALVAEIAPGAQRPDAVGAAILAEGAARAAAQLVDVNLAARPGDERHARAHQAVAAAAAAK